VWSIGLARVSAIFARSSRFSVSIVVFVSGGFWVVLAISSLYGAVSFSMAFLGGGAGLYLMYRRAEIARAIVVAAVTA
jgi:hypothetical protein